MAELTRALAGLRAADGTAFGGKSSALGELIAAGIPVPPGFAVSTAGYQAFVAGAGLEPMIASAMSGLEPGDVDAVGAVSHRIGEAMRSAPIPSSVRDEVAERYAGLGEPPVAVRSSALGEDSREATFAGQQETYLWVLGAEGVCDAVRDCWVSLYSPPAITYRARLRAATGEPAMGVAVQQMVDAEVSGVMFTCNPVSGDPSMVAINASWGLGLAVVGGEVTPDDFLVSKVTREVVREHVHAKEVEYVPDERGRGAVRREVPEERREVACLDAAALEALVERRPAGGAPLRLGAGRRVGDRERRRSTLEPVRPPVAAGHDRAGPARALGGCLGDVAPDANIRRRQGRRVEVLLGQLCQQLGRRARDPRRHSELAEKLGGGLHLVYAPGGVCSAALEQAVEERPADHRRDLLLQPVAVARRFRSGHALDGRGGHTLHEHRADELHRGGVACLVRDDLDGHPQRPEHLGERLGGGAGGERRRADSLCRYRAEQGDVREAFADQPGKLALEGRRGRVQIAVDGLARRGLEEHRGPPRAPPPPRSR